MKNTISMNVITFKYLGFAILYTIKLPTPPPLPKKNKKRTTRRREEEKKKKKEKGKRHIPWFRKMSPKTNYIIEYYTSRQWKNGGLKTG